jgi:large subunit ribosomal protein L15
MDLTTVHNGVQKRRLKKRVARGVGSGHGKTGSRGHKGQYASAGARLPGITFVGGQTPLFRRTPKRGFNNDRFKPTANVINVSDLDAVFPAGAEVTAQAIADSGLANYTAERVRILGNGNLTKALTVHAHYFSKSAIEKITKAGGKAEIIPLPKKPVRNKMKPRAPKATK